MQRFTSPLAFALVLLMSLGFAGAAAAGDQVPFKGSFDGQSVQTLAPPVLYDEITATGKAAHLGKFEMVINATVELATRTASGTIVFVAANGDTLTAEFTGSSEPSDTPGVILITEEATVTGGTGRFEGATGEFTIKRLFRPATGEVTGEIEGTISSPGASKR